MALTTRSANCQWTFRSRWYSLRFTFVVASRNTNIHLRLYEYGTSFTWRGERSSLFAPGGEWKWRGRRASRLLWSILCTWRCNTSAKGLTWSQQACDNCACRRWQRFVFFHCLDFFGRMEVLYKILMPWLRGYSRNDWFSCTGSYELTLIADILCPSEVYWHLAFSDNQYSTVQIKEKGGRCSRSIKFGIFIAQRFSESTVALPYHCR